jgi:2-oxo-4-hydroxy-4-carboxy-5-ureidoimidazoline decarboxylase
MDVAALDALSDADAQTALACACGARHWIQAMARARPFGAAAQVAAAAERAFDALTDADWLEAFAHHPRIGDVSRLRERFAGSGELSEKEQGTALGTAHEAVLEQLLAANQRYEARHGHIFIVCASGKSAAEMLGLLLARENLEPAAELRTCALEQRKITRLRLGLI